ncbi:MAG: hypothetical protein ACOCRK_03825 [bacterium]
MSYLIGNNTFDQEYETETNTLIGDEGILEPGMQKEYWFELNSSQNVNIEFESEKKLDFYIIDEEEFQKMRGGLEYHPSEGGRKINSYEEEITLCAEKWYFVVWGGELEENTSFEIQVSYEEII